MSESTDKELVMKDYKLMQWWASSHYPQINLLVISIDSRVLISFLPFAFHMADWTLYIALFFTAIFAWFGHLQMSVPISLKKGRSFTAGKRRSVKSNKRRMKRFTHG